jgi:cellulose biosynthesis protein BcsQ
MAVIRMKKIALLNLKGGCGSTTIAANLADILAAEHKTWLWQTDDSDQLSLHFQSIEPELVDWKHTIQQPDFSSLLDQFWLENSAFKLFSTQRYSESRMGDFENFQKVMKLLDVLQRFGDDSNEADTAYSIIQLPSQFYQVVNLMELSKLVDLLIVVAVADAQSYQRLSHLEADSFFYQPNIKLVINKFNPEFTIENDIYTVINDEYVNKTFPEPLYHSPEFLESAANMLTIKQYAPKSLAYENMLSLANWSKQWIKANTQHE